MGVFFLEGWGDGGRGFVDMKKVQYVYRPHIAPANEKRKYNALTCTNHTLHLQISLQVRQHTCTGTTLESRAGVVLCALSVESQMGILWECRGRGV